MPPAPALPPFELPLAALLPAWPWQVWSVPFAALTAHAAGVAAAGLRLHDRPAAQWYGLFAGDEVVPAAFAGLRWWSPPGGPVQAHVRTTYTEPERRGCGLGTLLARLLVGLAAAGGAAALTVSTRQPAFWEGVGFARVRPLKVAPWWLLVCPFPDPAWAD